MYVRSFSSKCRYVEREIDRANQNSYIFTIKIVSDRSIDIPSIYVRLWSYFLSISRKINSDSNFFRFEITFVCFTNSYSIKWNKKFWREVRNDIYLIKSFFSWRIHYLSTILIITSRRVTRSQRIDAERWEKRASISVFFVEFFWHLVFAVTQPRLIAKHFRHNTKRWINGSRTLFLFNYKISSVLVGPPLRTHYFSLLMRTAIFLPFP